MKTVRIGFIGAGKVGCSLGKYLSERISEVNGETETEPKRDGAGTAKDDFTCFSKPAFKLSGYFSRSASSAIDAAAFTGSHAFDAPASLLDASDMIFMTVPDGAIGKVGYDLMRYPAAAGKIFCHCSGSLPSSVFTAAAEKEEDGAPLVLPLTCSLHPLLAVADHYQSWERFKDAYFTFEGSDAAFETLSPLLQLMGNNTGRIEADQKILYHAACVFFSNLTVGLAACGEDLFRACGLDDEFSKAAWHTLFQGNCENIIAKGVTEALTGPAERGDTVVIEKHLEALGAYQASAAVSNRAANADTIYRELTKVLFRIAAEKHPERK
ncbi:MAG: DUF2520 domain-containing protein [Clostridiales Family XIII bacterium]|jgi:predicted short-subunit dehydrogenase-like oxidoreductase (DUF2520 family)|nr:DUF2520 domain-containing protein [Clostridiales Family XIII bacterium]